MRQLRITWKCTSHCGIKSAILTTEGISDSINDVFFMTPSRAEARIIQIRLSMRHEQRCHGYCFLLNVGEKHTHFPKTKLNYTSTKVQKGSKIKTSSFCRNLLSHDYFPKYRSDKNGLPRGGTNQRLTCISR